MKRSRSSTETKCKSASSSSNGERLPKWAKLVPPRHPSDSRIVEDFLEEQIEDDYLRTFTYHSIAQFLQQQVQKALQTSCAVTVRVIQQDRLYNTTKNCDVNVTSKSISFEQLPTSLDKIDETKTCLISNIRADVNSAIWNGTKNKPMKTDGASMVGAKILPNPAATSPGIDSDIVYKCTVRKNSIYDPLLLPVLSLDHGPFTIHDKLLLTSHFSHQIQNAEPRTCCVSLPSSYFHHLIDDGHHKYSTPLQEDFMNQCWNQELCKLFSHTNDPSRKTVIHRLLKKVRSSVSITEQLIYWSSQTIHFDNIVIFWNIEHGSIMYNHHSVGMLNNKLSFEHFIQWCAERRALDGIPISIVLFNPKNGYRQSMPFFPTIQSMIGLRLRDITRVPVATTILDLFWENIFSDTIQQRHPTAFLLYSICKSYSKDVSNIFYTFQHQDQSITRFIRAIKALIAQYLALPSNFGTFPSTVAVILDKCYHPTYYTSLSNRITSLFCDTAFLNYLANNGSSLSKAWENGSSGLFHEIENYGVNCLIVSIILHVYTTIWGKYAKDMDHYIHSTSIKLHLSLPSFLLLDRQQRDPQNYSKFQNFLLNDEDRQLLVSLLFKYRTETYNSSSFACGPMVSSIDLHPCNGDGVKVNMLERVRHVINELIILFDHCISLYDVLRCLESFLIPIMQNYSNQPNDSKVCHPPALPRRDYVHALLLTDDGRKNSNGSENAAFISIPGCLYQIIQNRISITEVEWYEAFLLRYLADIGCGTVSANMFLLFGCGIRHLQISGLIRRTVGRNATVQYERTALVWCGGD